MNMIIQWSYIPNTGGAQGADSLAFGVAENYVGGTASPPPPGMMGCSGQVGMGTTRLMDPKGMETGGTYGGTFGHPYVQKGC